MVVPEQRELEAVLRGVNGDGARPRRAVEAVYSLALDPRQVDRVVESADNTMIAEGTLAR